MTKTTHVTVLLQEAVRALLVKPDQWYVDATIGSGGHTQAILDQGGKVLGLDFDQTAIDRVSARFQPEIVSQRVVVKRENFDRLSAVITELRAAKQIGDSIQGILFDFGTSTEQLMSSERGLSFSDDSAPLDMRLDSRLGVKAADLLKVLNVKQLAQLFRDFGGESHANQIAKAIVELREKNPAQLDTVGGLLKIVARVKPYKQGHLHPATKVFQALRIAVNDELDNISRALPQALDEITPGGRVVTIAFHEGEDRLAKQTFANWEQEGRGERITQKPIQPSEFELAQNPRSRSAKLRIFERKQA